MTNWEVKCEDIKVLCYSQVQFWADQTLPSHLSALLKSVQVLLLGFSFTAIELAGKWFQQTVPLLCSFKGPRRDLQIKRKRKNQWKKQDGGRGGGGGGGSKRQEGVQ